MKPTAEDWPELLQLLDQALQLDEQTRPQWLAALPAAQARQLQALLERRPAMETQQFLAQPAQLPAPPRPAAEAGQRVGPWRLLHEIGRGGMAWVWLAERADGQGRRRVALKLPRAGWDDGLSARLRRERDILGSLEHPHIARLYDAGVDDQGRPWLALEHVQGEPIDVHCRERQLDTAARVALLRQVCAAVAFAHGRLVIHRDLKPSNVLVDAQGQVKLLDFGIARLLAPDAGDRGDAEPTALTAVSGRPLTPEYASPEQLRGETLGTASDIYSLGVLAYELLCERRPYRLGSADPAALDTALDRLWLAPPRRDGLPRERHQALRDGLEAVLAKALQRVPEQRYATVAALDDDLARHQAGQPVLASRRSPLALAWRWGQRHARGLAVAAGALLVLGLLVGAGATAAVVGTLVAGLGATAWQARQARRQAYESAAQRQRADLVQGFLVSLLAEGGVGLRDAEQRRTLAVGTLLAEAAGRLRQDTGLPLDAQLELLASIASIQLSLEQHDEVLAACSVLQQRWPQGARDPQVLARACELQARALLALGRPAEAAQVLQRGLQALGGATSPALQLQRLALLCWALRASIEIGTHAATEAAHAELLAVRGSLAPPWRDDVQVLSALAVFHASADQAADAERCWREALALVPAAEPQAWTTETLELRRQYARFLMSKARYADALAQLQALVATVERIAGPDHLLALQTSAMASRTLSTLGRHDEAEVLIDSVRARLRPLAGAQAERVRWGAEATLADLELNRGRAADAGRRLDTLPPAAFEGPMEERTWLLLIRARQRVDVGRFDEALADLARAEAAQRTLHDESHPDVLKVRNRRLVALLGAQRYTEAQALLDELLMGDDRLVPARVGSPTWLLQLNRLHLALEMEDVAPVRNLAAALWAGFDALPAAERSTYNEISLRLRMVRLALQEGDTGPAAEAHLQALEQAVAGLDAASGLRVTARAARADWHLRRGEHAEAGQHLDAAEALLERHAEIGPQVRRYPARVRERWAAAA